MASYTGSALCYQHLAIGWAQETANSKVYPPETTGCRYLDIIMCRFGKGELVGLTFSNFKVISARAPLSLDCFFYYI